MEKKKVEGKGRRKAERGARKGNREGKGNEEEKGDCWRREDMLVEGERQGE